MSNKLFDLSGKTALVTGGTHGIGMAMAVGLAGLFLESHPEPDKAFCDGPSALPLDLLEAFLEQMRSVDELVKSLPPLVIP